MVRDAIFIGKTIDNKHEYFVQNRCIGCKLCYSVCPHIGITKNRIKSKFFFIIINKGLLPLIRKQD